MINNDAFTSAASAMINTNDQENSSAAVVNISDIPTKSDSTHSADTKPRVRRKVNALSRHLELNSDEPEVALQAFAEKEGGASRKIDPKKISWNSKINQREQDWLNEKNPSFVRLRESIRTDEQKVAIWVVDNGDGTFRGVYGSRRSESCLQIARDVWAMVFSDVLSEEDAFLAAHAENNNRSDLSNYEEAQTVLQYKNLKKSNSDAAIGAFFNKSRHWVARQISFASASPKLLKCIADPWRLTERAYRDCMLGIKGNPVREENMNRIINKMAMNTEILPYRELFKLLNPPEKEKSSTFKYDKKGHVLTEISPLKLKGGRPYRTINVFGNTKKELIALIGELVSDMESDVDFDTK